MSTRSDSGNHPGDPAPPQAGGDARPDVPRAAEPPRALSPSRAADFMTCPLMYRFRVIDRLPEKPRASAARGTLVHAVLERLFDDPAAERTPPRARALVAPAWERMLAARPELAELFAEGDGAAAGAGAEEAGSGGGGAEGAAARLAEWLAGAEQLVERWFTLEDPARLEPEERELFVETVLASGLKLRGVIDRVDVAPTGDVRVVDYKTGKAPPPEYAADALFQIKFYALVLWRLRGRVPRRLQLVYLGSGDVLTYDPDEADLRGVERKLHALWQAIQRATESGDWRPRPGRLCGWCDFQDSCPAFGGTPPPYPLGTADLGMPGPRPAGDGDGAQGRMDTA
ncbi:RecB family exonuclease [Streptomyces sp. MAR4 CNX-425]|uniref:RecB family exonuclease n=1 Tax=Streptomyces sp. MAR4 CNX-425 TaxID=3406343 RepID=UPI003B5096CC